MKVKKFALISLVLSFNVVAAPLAPDVIYGEDNRIDTFQSTSALHKKLALGTAAQIPNSSLKLRGTTVELLGEPLSSMPGPQNPPLCAQERFHDQPTASDCSGFLVADNILVTAGHCMQTADRCSSMSWVFNYKVSSSTQTAVSVAAKDVYKCKRVIKQVLNTNTATDFAIIELDRANPGKALKLAKVAPVVGSPIFMIGHPSGLPQKITTGAKVIKVVGQSFRTDLDAFGGNSGSSVFNAAGEIVGILVNGDTDYRLNSRLNCVEVNQMSSARNGEGVSAVAQITAFLTKK
jgi:V8-like Glu-specific endopeptidase